MRTARPERLTPAGGDREPPAAPARPGAWPRVWAAFFAAVFAYVYLRVNPALVFQAHWVQPALSPGVPVFRWGTRFLGDFLFLPGGLTEYAAALLSQYHQIAWLGAVIITGLMALLCLEAFVLLRTFAGEPPRLLHLVPVFPLLLLYGFYYDPLRPMLALALVLGGAAVYVTKGGATPPRRLGVFVLLLALLHSIAAGAVLVYAALCTLYELTAGGRRRLAPAVLVLGAAMPYALGLLWPHAGTADAYRRLLPFHEFALTPDNAVPLVLRSEALRLVLYAFFPAAAVAAYAAGRLRRAGRRRPIAGVAALAMLAVAVVLAHDGAMKAQTAVDYHASRRNWPKVVKNASRGAFNPLDYLFVNSQLNRALFHLGELADGMFAYEQDPVGHMLCKDIVPSQVLRHRAWVASSEMLLDLGLVNEAEHMACEAIETRGSHPRLLEVMMFCNLAKGRTEAARILLGALSRDPVYGRRARSMLRRMRTDPDLSQDPFVARLRELRVTENVAQWGHVEDALKRLLSRNPGNRMAYEYLLARYLIYGRLGDCVREFARLGEVGYRSVPRHFEEALLLYAVRTGQMPEMNGLRISARTQERFEAFRRAMAGARTRLSRMKALADFADSYMFYYFFVLPPEPVE